MTGQGPMTIREAARRVGRRAAAVADAARALAVGFAQVLLPDPETASALASVLSSLGIHGGATSDALVALAARDHHVALASRDARALGTYAALGVVVRRVPSAV